MKMNNIGNDAAAAIGLYIPAWGMARALNSTQVGRTIAAMAGSEPLSTSTQYLARGLTTALNGTKIAIQNADGSKVWGTTSMDKNGEPTFTKEP
jgi:hypothetical protein